ncbi:ribosome recycling factor [Ammoniphilus sp. CFH 90114]|uniref:ribosome recycling factor n=1 Tax=Ammoniphilus sp. CFH 90114 TaxID=2493665 RepID=UPI00100DBF40|nr:ribosome recycling factor [Ammoniphilus sp. CFH 90114]RXT15145.1 ribosome recycling factor [Ammoniphilus sp. CFH 90114]
MPQTVIQNAEERMSKALSALKKELSTLRAGRATPALLDKVQVDYYGTPTPVSQMANVSVPEARLITIQPWDKTQLGPIEKAILKSDLGLTPTNDGSVIRLMIPPLTEERRAELVKLVKKEGEEAKVAIRNVRRDANDAFKKFQKDGSISEDDLKRYQDNIQKSTDSNIQQVDKIVQEKEKEIMEV